MGGQPLLLLSQKVEESGGSEIGGESGRQMGRVEERERQGREEEKQAMRRRGRESAEGRGSGRQR